MRDRHPTLARFDSIRTEALRLALADRDATIARHLREKGPGWAAGYRLADDPPQEEGRVNIAWDIHLVQLVDGELPFGRADFTYVTLKENNSCETN